MQLYQYRYTTFRELLRERAWWHRALIGEYVGPVTLGKTKTSPASGD
ncbi:conserved transmembrane domain protein [Mycobacterium xenopi 4042]|uniref:Conserved transmembrane domain protein n=1 Tax=Mycobacterium xenopi 4042 TaxID=1299334 RepID=X7Z9L5_MYCXE|nr:conserved transmembrane domain protein [Mycobacterium xenopi 4042]